MSASPKWPSTSVLVLPMIYITFFITITRNESHPTPLSLAKTREFISFIHCTLTTLATLSILSHENILQLLSPSPPPLTNATISLITTKSPLANALTRYETLYILSDTLILLLAHNQQQSMLRTSTSTSSTHAHPQRRGLNYVHLLIHHTIFLLSFSLLQFYIYHNWERGVLVILLLMLQNASTPFGALAWYIRNTYPTKTKLRFGAELAYVVMYAVWRVGLVGWIVVRFAQCVEGRGVWEGWASLRWHCQVGTVGLEGVNLWWLGRVAGRFGREWVWGRGRGRDGEVNDKSRRGWEGNQRREVVG